MGEEGSVELRRTAILASVNPQEILTALDAEIARLQQARSLIKIRRTGTSRPPCEVRVDNHCCPQETDTVARSTEKDCRRAAEALGEAKGCPRGLAKTPVLASPGRLETRAQLAHESEPCRAFSRQQEKSGLSPG